MTNTKAVAVTSPAAHVMARAGEWNKELAVIIRDSLAPGLSGKQLLVYSKICQATGLDPLRRQIYAWISKGRLVIQVGIGGWRAIAARTGEYAGQTPQAWCGPDGEWRDVWLSEDPPEAARVGVYRRGNHEPTYAVVTWRDFQRTAARSGAKGATPWDESPAHMLSIAAERHALQKACPEAYEKAMGIMQEAGASVQVMGDDELPELPLNADPETGEIEAPAEVPALVAEAPAAPSVNWSAFWAEAKSLGFDAKAVHKAIGVESIAHFDAAAVADVLELLRANTLGD